MAANRPNRIDLIVKSGRYTESRAAGVIKPGHLIKGNGTPGSTVVNNNTAGEPCEPRFALGDHLQGKTITDAYASGDVVFELIAGDGDVVLARLAAGQNVAADAALQANNDGTLMARAAGKAVVAYAKEAVDATAAEDFIRVRVVNP